MVGTSLDRFIKKIVIKKYFLYYKTIQASGHFFYHLKTGHKLCPKNDHLKTGQSGFQMLTVHIHLYCTVGHRIPNRPIFEWSFFGRFFCPDFGFASLDRFINKSHKKYFIHAKTV